MWESRLLLAKISKGLWKEGEACFWLSTLSIAPAFPQLSQLARVFQRCPGASFAITLAFS